MIFVILGFMFLHILVTKIYYISSGFRERPATKFR